jgi:hypothetical protein
MPNSLSPGHERRLGNDQPNDASKKNGAEGAILFISTLGVHDCRVSLQSNPPSSAPTVD